MSTENQVKSKEPIYRFRHKTGFKDVTDYIEIQGDKLTYFKLDGSRISYDDGGLERLPTFREAVKEGVWTEEVIHPEPEQPKRMTIREAAKKLQEIGVGCVDDLHVELERWNNAWRLKCSIYHGSSRYTGVSFESCFEQIEVDKRAKAGLFETEADRIIDL